LHQFSEILEKLLNHSGISVVLTSTLRPLLIFLLRSPQLITKNIRAKCLLALTLAAIPLLLSVSVLPVRAVCAVPEPDFDMTADPDELTIAIGGSASTTITVTSLNSFAGTVTLTVLDYSEVTGSLNVPSVTLTPNGQETATLTVTHDPLSPSGDYSIDVTGTSGTLFRSVSVDVHVIGPDFSVAAAPGFLTFSAGESGDSTITVASLNSYSGTVDLLANAIPFLGLTTTFSADFVDLTPGSSQAVTLTIDSTVSTSPGVYIVYIEASDGFTSHFTSVFVTVTGPDFTMLADPAFLEIPAGSSAISTITLQSLYGFAGTVNLAVVPPPPTGITAALSSPSVTLISGGTATSTLTMNIDASIAVPTFATVHVVGTSGSKTRNTGVFVIVPGPAISLSANPSLLSLDPGESGSSTITVTSLLGFEGPVDLTADPSDPCLDVSLSLTTVNVPLDGSATSVLTVTADNTTPSGTYSVDVDGTGGFFVSDFATVLVTVGGVDTTPPTWPVPSSLTSSGATQTSVILSWTAAEDDVSVDYYIILQDSLPLAEIIPGTTTTHIVTGLTTSTTYDFQVVAWDAAGNFAPGPTATVTTPGPENSPPVLNPIGNSEVSEESTLTFTATATDPDSGQTLTLTTSTLPSGATWTSTPTADTVTGTLTWTPTEAQGPNTYSVTVTVSDGSLFDSETITLTVNEVNVAPVLNPISDKFVQEGTPLSFTATASDSDLPAQTLSFAMDSATTGTFPEGATMSSTGAFSWTPTTDQGQATYKAKVTVSDGDLQDSKEFTITVSETPANNSPELTPIGPRQVNEGTLLTITVSATDSDPSQTLTLSATGLPQGAIWTSTPATGTVTGTLTWTPTEAQGPSAQTITFSVSDGTAADSEDVNVNVSEVNTVPILGSIGNKSVQEGNLLTFQATATDPDVPANTLSYTLAQGSPAGATITLSGAFSWTPNADEGPGTYTVTVNVSDGTLADSESFTITVTEPQRAPTAPTPLYQEPWFYAVVAVVALAAVGGVVVMARGRAKRV
jgi:hypothetical protein